MYILPVNKFTQNMHYVAWRWRNTSLCGNITATSYTECVKFYDTLEQLSSSWVWGGRWVNWDTGTMEQVTWCYLKGRSNVIQKKGEPRLSLHLLYTYNGNSRCLWNDTTIQLRCTGSHAMLHSATCHKTCKITAVRTLIWVLFLGQISATNTDANKPN